MLDRLPIELTVTEQFSPAGGKMQGDLKWSQIDILARFLPAFMSPQPNKYRNRLVPFLCTASI